MSCVKILFARHIGYRGCSVSAKMAQSGSEGKHIPGVLGWKPKRGRSHGKRKQEKSGAKVANIVGGPVRNDRDIGVVSEGKDALGGNAEIATTRH